MGAVAESRTEAIAGARFGRAALAATSAAGLLGFVAILLTTSVWRQQPVLSLGLLLVLAAVPAVLVLALRRTRRSDAAAAPIVSRFPVVSFDLRGLIVGTLLEAQAQAAESGRTLRWRIDPQLPHSVSGRPQLLEEVLRTIAAYALEEARPAAARIAIGGKILEGRRIRLDLQVETAAPDELPSALQTMARLLASEAGSMEVGPPTEHRGRLTISLVFEVAAAEAVPVPDLDRRPVLIVTEDDALAHQLAEPLASWNAEARWPSDLDDAFADLAEDDSGRRAVVLVDGRQRLLAAAGVAHQAAKLGSNAPFVIVIASPVQIATLLEVEDGELDGFIPAPPTETLLANALNALPLTVAPRSRAAVAGPPADEAPAKSSEFVAPVSLPVTAPALDLRAVEALCALETEPGFLAEVVESFRLDARRIMQRIDAAAANGDCAAFVRGVVALRRAAGPLGGVPLCELATVLETVSERELRRDGASWIARLDREIDRFTAALTAYLATKERTAR